MAGETLKTEVMDTVGLSTTVVEAVNRANAFPSGELRAFLHDVGHGIVDRVVHLPQEVGDLVTHRHGS